MTVADATHATASTSAPTAAARRTTPPIWQRFTDSHIAVNLLSVAIVLAVWQVASTMSAFSTVVPGVPETVVRSAKMFSSWDEASPMLITLRRIVTGYMIGCFVGVVLGSAMGTIRIVREAVLPYVNFLRSVTPVAWVVPATVWFGVGEMPLYFIVVYASMFPVILNTIAGFAGVPRSKTRMASVFGAGPGRRFFSIALPSALPFIVTGMRLALGYSFMSVVGGEMVASSTGLGFLIYDSRVNFDSATMFAGILIVGAAGFIGDRIFVMLRNRVAHRYFTGSSAT